MKRRPSCINLRWCIQIPSNVPPARFVHPTRLSAALTRFAGPSCSAITLQVMVAWASVSKGFDPCVQIFFNLTATPLDIFLRSYSNSHGFPMNLKPLIVSAIVGPRIFLSARSNPSSRSTLNNKALRKSKFIFANCIDAIFDYTTENFQFVPFVFVKPYLFRGGERS
jgi:hypothetical protein